VSDRANQLISDILRRIHEVIVEHDVTYEEYQTAKQWFVDVGEAGEWPLFGDVTSSVEGRRSATARRLSRRSSARSTSLMLAPGGAARAAAPARRARRPDHVSGRVTDVEGKPLANAIDIWQADAEAVFKLCQSPEATCAARSHRRRGREFIW
jgi:catechol 1,2-dioxygenase